MIVFYGEINIMAQIKISNITPTDSELTELQEVESQSILGGGGNKGGHGGYGGHGGGCTGHGRGGMFNFD